MRPWRFVYAFGCWACLLCCGQVSLAQRTDFYPFVSSSGNSPVYAIVQISGAGSLISYPAVNGPANWDKNINSPVLLPKLYEACFSALGLKYRPLSDFVSALKYSNFSSNGVPVYGSSDDASNYVVCYLDNGRSISIDDAIVSGVVNSATGCDSLLVAYTPVVSLTVRPRNGQPVIDVFIQLVFDCSNAQGLFFYVYGLNQSEAYLGRFPIASNNFRYSVSRAGATASYQLFGSFSFKYDDNFNLTKISTSEYSLPFMVKGNLDIRFCSSPNHYWNKSVGTSENTTYSVFPSLINTSFLPFQNTWRVFAVDGSEFDQGATLFNQLDGLDTDSGGMTDFHEWYQTKHNLLDPSDDRSNTSSADAPVLEELKPEFPEAQSVVDIGKFTAEEYARYWDKQVTTIIDSGSENTQKILDKLDEIQSEDQRFYDARLTMLTDDLGGLTDEIKETLTEQGGNVTEALTGQTEALTESLGDQTQEITDSLAEQTAAMQDYLDDKIGTGNFEDPELEEPTVEPTDKALVDVPTLQNQLQGAVDNSRLTGSAGNLLSGIKNSRPADLTIRPIIDFEDSLGVKLDLGTYSVDPRSLLEQGQRKSSSALNVNVSVYFRLLRLALLAIEALYFVWAVYRLIYSGLAGVSDTQED